ncbi:MAG: tRNA dihydrouridine synthase DusB [Cocleimonas sp.]|nr:tRNA dihydrouridine synthase DusB [Cocleimonas sp.]
MPKPLTIGHYQLTSNILLAPMAGITNRPYRDICRRFGAGLASSEMIASDVNLWNSKKSATRFISKNEAEPRCAQIVGTDPKVMAEAARRCVDQGVQILDINMGCPAKKVCHKAAGSALLQYPEQVKKILTCITTAVDIPVTLKTRTGWSDNNKNVLEIAKIAEQSGIAALYLHGRTRTQKYTGTAEYETIRQVKRDSSLSIIVNGDIKSAQDAKFALDYTQADAIMLGRVSQGRPWIFDEIDYYLNTGKIKKSLSHKEMSSVAIDHIFDLHQHYKTTFHQEKKPFNWLKYVLKVIDWYLISIRRSNVIKIPKKVFMTHTPEEQLDVFIRVLNNLTPTSPENPRLKNKGN